MHVFFTLRILIQRWTCSEAALTVQNPLFRITAWRQKAWMVGKQGLHQYILENECFKFWISGLTQMLPLHQLRATTKFVFYASWRTACHYFTLTFAFLVCPDRMTSLCAQKTRGAPENTYESNLIGWNHIINGVNPLLMVEEGGASLSG